MSKVRRIPPVPPVSPEEMMKIWSHINMTDSCWNWTGTIVINGYGYLDIGGAMQPVHRLVFRELVGPFSSKSRLFHLCDNRLCCNPQHLSLGKRPKRPRKSVTHCRRGHLFDEQNTYVHASTGTRQCRACARLRRNGYYKAATKRAGQ